MTGQVDLADMLDRESLEIGERIEAAIDRGHDDIVEVEQQATAAAPGERAQEFGFGHLLALEAQIGRWILDEDASAERGLRFVDVPHRQGQRRLRVGKRQQVVQEDPVMRGPGQMFGDDEGLVSIGDGLQAREMARRHAAGGADRQSHAVQGNRIERTDALEEEMRRTARPHVVLGMHLEPADIGPGVEDVPLVLGLQPGAGTRGAIRRHDERPYIGARVPLRFMPSFRVTSMVAHEPLATYFHALES